MSRATVACGAITVYEHCSASIIELYLEPLPPKGSCYTRFRFCNPCSDLVCPLKQRSVGQWQYCILVAIRARDNLVAVPRRGTRSPYKLYALTSRRWGISVIAVLVPRLYRRSTEMTAVKENRRNARPSFAGGRRC